MRDIDREGDRERHRKTHRYIERQIERERERVIIERNRERWRERIERTCSCIITCLSQPVIIISPCPCCAAGGHVIAHLHYYH